MHLSSVVVFHTCSFYHLVFSSLLFYFFSVFVFLYKNVYVRARVCVFVSQCVYFLFYLFSVDSFFYFYFYILCCSTLSMHLLMRPDRASIPKITQTNSLRPEYMFATPSIYYGQMNSEPRQRQKRRKKTDKTKYIFLCVYRHSGCSCVPSSSPILFFYSIPFRSIL